VSPAGTAEGPTLTAILCVNCGSSTVKAALVVVDDPAAGPVGARRLVDCRAEEVTGPTPFLRTPAGEVEAVGRSGHAAAVEAVLDAIERHGREAGHPAPDVVAHRLVHGGPHRWAPVRLDDRVLDELDQVAAFAPLHLPPALAAARRLLQARPDLPAVGCFDTAFHHDLPEVATRYALPEALHRAGVRRYGFHGLSYEWLVARLGADALGRAVLAHLGAGSSMAAVDHGRPVDTTMGMTPTGGLVMATRTGDLDPGLVVHLLRGGGGVAVHTVDELADLVDHGAGLAALGGHGGDVRDLTEAAGAGDTAARLALDVYAHSAAKHLAAMSASLGGLDTVVFTAGIGEHAAGVRAAIAGRLGHLGVAVEPARNESAAGDAVGGEGVVISPEGAPVTVRVVATDEEAVMAHHAVAVLAA
jgi:acetate kinase